MGAAGLRLAGPGDISQLHDFAERLIGPPLASVDVVLSVQDQTRSSAFLMHEGDRLTAIVCELPLTVAGLAALQEAQFRGTDPQRSHVARPGGLVAAGYLWCFAAASRRGAAAAVKAVVGVREEVYPTLPYFARVAAPHPGVATPNAERVFLRRFNCAYYPGQPTLLYSPNAQMAGRTAA
jgi:hypothetical protein